MSINVTESCSVLMPLDPAKPETWINSPAPAVDPFIQEELTRIGGLVPPGNGEFSGEPVLKLVWGQTETFFIGGQQRLRFQDNRIPIKAPFTQKYRAFAVRDEVLPRLAAWLRLREEANRAAYLRCDWAAASRPARAAEYLAEHESGLDYYSIDCSRMSSYLDLVRTGALLPKNYSLVPDGFDYLPVGKQCFFVVQWLPANVLVSESDWAENRYGIRHHPESNSEKFLDLLGEYPRGGAYDFVVWQIAGGESANDYEYVAPTFENAVLPVREMFQSREQAAKSEKDKTARFQQDFDREMRQQEKEQSKMLEAYREIARDALPVGGGNPTSVPTINS